MNIIHPERLPQWPGMIDAMHDVHQFALQTGREKLIALDPNGRRLHVAEGDDHSVVIPDARELDLSGAYIVHSHPNISPLSPQDFAVVGSRNAAGILATMPDGGWSASSGWKFDVGDQWRGPSSQYRFVLDRFYGWGDQYHYRGFNNNVAGVSAGFRIIDEAFHNDAIKDHKIELGPEGKRYLHLAESIDPRGEKLRLE